MNNENGSHSEPPDPGAFRFRSTWNVYLMSCVNETMLKVFTVRTIKDFWGWLNFTSPEPDWVWILCREGHSPKWENPQNKHSGSLSFIVPVKIAWTSWEDLCMLAVGETLIPGECKCQVYSLTLCLRKGARVCNVKAYIKDIRKFRLADFHVDGSGALPNVKEWRLKA